MKEKCSFCHKSAKEVEKLFVVPKAGICVECIKSVYNQWQEGKAGWSKEK